MTPRRNIHESCTIGMHRMLLVWLVCSSLFVVGWSVFIAACCVICSFLQGLCYCVSWAWCWMHFLDICPSCKLFPWLLGSLHNVVFDFVVLDCFIMDPCSHAAPGNIDFVLHIFTHDWLIADHTAELGDCLLCAAVFFQNLIFWFFATFCFNFDVKCLFNISSQICDNCIHIEIHLPNNRHAA